VIQAIPRPVAVSAGAVDPSLGSIARKGRVGRVAAGARHARCGGVRRPGTWAIGVLATPLPARPIPLFGRGRSSSGSLGMGPRLTRAGRIGLPLRALFGDEASKPIWISGVPCPRQGCALLCGALFG